MEDTIRFIPLPIFWKDNSSIEEICECKPKYPQDFIDDVVSEMDISYKIMLKRDQVEAVVNSVLKLLDMHEIERG